MPRIEPPPRPQYLHACNLTRHEIILLGERAAVSEPHNYRVSRHLSSRPAPPPPREKEAPQYVDRTMRRYQSVWRSRFHRQQSISARLKADLDSFDEHIGNLGLGSVRQHSAGCCVTVAPAAFDGHRPICVLSDFHLLLLLLPSRTTRPKKKSKEKKRAEAEFRRQKEEAEAARRIQAQARGRQARRRQLAAAAERGIGPKLTDIKSIGGHRGGGALELEQRHLLVD